MARRNRENSSTFRAVDRELRDGFRGTYGHLAGRVGSIPKAVGQSVKKFSRENLWWDVRNVYSKKTGRPAFLS